MECKYPAENTAMGKNWLSTDNIYIPYNSPILPLVSPCIKQLRSFPAVRRFSFAATTLRQTRYCLFPPSSFWDSTEWHNPRQRASEVLWRDAFLCGLIPRFAFCSTADNRMTHGLEIDPCILSFISQGFQWKALENWDTCPKFSSAWALGSNFCLNQQ